LIGCAQTLRILKHPAGTINVGFKKIQPTELANLHIVIFCGFSSPFQSEIQKIKTYNHSKKYFKSCNPANPRSGLPLQPIPPADQKTFHFLLDKKTNAW
jgi:hypothetical protein